MQVSLLGFLCVSVIASVSCHFTFCDPPANSPSTEMLAFTPVADSEKHVYIGGLFDTRSKHGESGGCGSYMASGIHNMEAFFWALRTVKTRYPAARLLQNITVAGFAWDQCQSEINGLRVTSSFEMCIASYGMPKIRPKLTFGFVGPERDEEVEDVAKLLVDTGNTVISPSARSTMFDGTNYQYFLRTVPSDTKQAEALVAIAKHLKWKHIQVVHQHNTYGAEGAMAVKTAATANDICVVQTIIMPTDLNATALDETVSKLLMQEPTKGVILFAKTDGVNAFYKAIERNSNAFRDFAWIVSDGLCTNNEALMGIQNMQTLGKGAITVTVQAPDYTSNFKEMFQTWYRQQKPDQNNWNPFFKNYWMQKFQCKLPNMESSYATDCDIANQNLMNEVINDRVGNIITAVDALVHGIDAVQKNECTNTDFICTNFINDNRHRDLIFNEVKKTSLDISGSSMGVFNDGGESATSRYSLTMYTSTTMMSPIGSYNNGALNINGTSSIMEISKCSENCDECDYIFPTTPRTTVPSTTTTPQTTTPIATSPAPTPRALTYGLRFGLPTWAIVLLILAGVGILVAIVFEFFILSKLIGTPLARVRSMWLGQVLLFGILLMYLVCIAYAFEPTMATCGIVRFGVGVTYALVFSILVVKGIVILSSKSLGYLKGLYQVLLLLFAWIVQIVIDAEWLILVPPQTVYNEKQAMYTCNHTFEGHLQSLVYVMFLILVATLVAVRSHGVITNHREGIFIGIAAGFSIPIWLAWTLVGALHSNRDFQDPVTAYGLFINATLILFAMFLPKVRQLSTMGVEGIYLEDDTPDEVYGGSMVYAPPSYKSRPGPGSVVYVNSNGMDDTYANVVTTNPGALHLKHPGSVRSAPIYSVRPSVRTSGYYSGNGKVLTVTNDLTGRMPSDKRGTLKAQSEIGVRDVSIHSSRHSNGGTMKRTRSASDLGAL